MRLCSGVCAAWVLSVGVVGAGLLVPGVQAQPEKKPASTPQPQAPSKQGEKPTGKAPPAPPPEMAAWFEMGKPGPEHELLKLFEGKWNGKVEMPGDAAGGPPSQGVMINSPVLGGRFLRQEWKGEFMGQPFEGLSFWGYDRGKKKWIGTWMDTVGTGVMISEGDYDSAKRVWTSVARMTDPEGKEAVAREVVTVVDRDTHTMEMFEVHDGQEVLSMKITYTRVK